MRLFKQISKSERHVIQKMTYSGVKKQQIGNYLGRHHSTIYREIQRNKTTGYQHEAADTLATQRRRRNSRKLDQNKILRLIVVSLLFDKNSPSLIAFYLKSNFPDDPTMHISHEAIYQWIYQQNNLSIPSCLFTRRKRRQDRANIYRNRGIFLEKRNIRERPVEADDKSEFGHLEGDLISSTNQDAYILTLNDRKTMNIWGLPVQTKDPEVVCRAVVETLEHLPAGLVKTITFDNGSEFNSYPIIEKALGSKVYFADPYCSWQRGLNEHLNGRIRQYLPKGKSFAGLTEEAFQGILFAINNRPRKSRNWRSPMSLLQEALVAFES